MRANNQLIGRKKILNTILNLLVIGVLLAPSSHTKAENPIQPDRPGFSTGTYTIDPGNIYIEMGYEFNFSSQNIKPNYHKIPQTNIRFGLLPNIEMNITWEGLKATNDLKVTDAFGLGAKYRLVQTDDYNISLLGKVDLSDFANDINITPLLGLLWDYELTSHIGTFGVVQLSHEGLQDFCTEASLGLALPLGKHFHIHGEYFIRAYPKQSDLSHNADIGITYLITDNIQVDAYYATELTSNAFRHVGFGFATRF
jgi:hypothetical protein